MRHPHLSFRCGLQVTQTVAESLNSQAELAMLLLDGGHTLEHHHVILPEERGALRAKNLFDSDLSEINKSRQEKNRLCWLSKEYYQTQIGKIFVILYKNTKMYFPFVMFW